MKRRTIGLGLVTGFAVLAGALAGGCSSGGGAGEAEHGTLSFPLVTEGASGTKYRLRDATFQITSEYYYYDESGGGGGADGGPGVITVSSEDDLAATSIAVSVERGYKYIRLLPGWHMEKIEGGSATPVEATLLSDEYQWVYVSPHSTSWVSYEFGLGDRSLWFNGKLNVDIKIYEDPSEVYGGVGGAGGQPGDIDYGYGGAY